MISSRSLVCLVAVVALMTPLARSADDAANPWPQWQGPNRNNISPETGLLKEWPKGGPPLVWKIHGVGAGFSTVSVAQGKIFTMGDASDAAYLFALNLDGKQLWKAQVGKTGGGGGYPGPRSAPAISNNLVVTLGQFGDLICADVNSGDIKWHKNLKTDFNGKMMSGWGYAESVLIDNGHVICTPGGADGAMIALDLNTGNTVWRSTDEKDPAAYSSAIAVEIGGKRQYVQLTGASVFGVAADDGKLLWRAERTGKTAVIPTPVFKDDSVFVTSGYGIGCNLFHITAADGKFDAKEVYSNREMKNHHGGVVLVGDYIYGASDPGLLTCMKFKTGAVKWKDRDPGKGSLTCADGNLYFREEGTGDVSLIQVTPDAYHLISRFKQPDRSTAKAWPHPVIADGKLYLRDQDLLLCYDVKQK